MAPDEGGRIPNSMHESGSWRIREIVPDFILEDVWALPVHGGPADFSAFLEMVGSLDPAKADSRAARALWQLRVRLGDWLDLGGIRAADESSDGGAGKLPIPGTGETSISERLPDDLRHTEANLASDSLPFVPIYRTDLEAAAELSNRTVHGVVHFAWAKRGEGRYQAQMAVYVKPRGRFGQAYMALIKPFRYLIVYPSLMRQFGRAWTRRVRS